MAAEEKKKKKEEKAWLLSSSPCLLPLAPPLPQPKEAPYTLGPSNLLNLVAHNQGIVLSDFLSTQFFVVKRAVVLV